MTGELPLEDRVERHRGAHPDASIPAIAGALGEPPAAIARTCIHYSSSRSTATRTSTPSP